MSLNKSNINIKNSDGDTAFQLAFKYEMDLEVIEKLWSLGADVHCRNNLGRSPLHDAAKYSRYGIESFILLLQNGASVNSFDYNGDSPLHDIFHNPLVSIDMIQYLLNHGAHPDWRNLKNMPPLSCVPTSKLSSQEKLFATRLLIHYTIIKKFNNTWTKEDLAKNDAILSFDFCKNAQQRKDLVNIRDQCVNELIELNKYYLKGNYSLFEFLFQYCYNINNFEKNTDELMIKNVTELVLNNKYPGFRDMLISCVMHFDIDAFIKKQRIYTIKPSSNSIVQLNFECVRKIVSFLSKVDVNNLIIAFLKV